MRLKIIACGVFEPYIHALREATPHTFDVTMMDAGLHARPNELRLLAQEEIDRASRAGGFDAILLLYGMCGRGVVNLEARTCPVIIPRAHDCITLFLGSHAAYRAQFNRHPGTFYHTLGWLTAKINPHHREAAELYQNYHAAGYDRHPDFKALKREFGEENARHILAFQERWRQHYTRAAYIDLGLPGEAGAMAFTRDMATIFNWKYEAIEGDASLLRSQLGGDWDDARFLVLPPHHRCIATGDDRLFVAVPVDRQAGDDVLSDREVTVDVIRGADHAGGIGLGIDAGGTFTDAVIYDLAGRRLLAKAKALTTYHDLVEGIRGALAQLPVELLRRVQVTALSTTLATNAIVEGRGHKVGVIVLSPWPWVPPDFDHQPVIHVPGAVGIGGDVITPLDEDAARDAVRRLIEQEHCAALVIAGYATVRNPEQANRVRELALGLYDRPVICVHEVSRRLDMYHGAQAAVANARLLPIVRDLLDSVHQALADHQVQGRLMVVKGDGTSVDESLARARPVETLLSGPAASVSGARLLAGRPDALILDIGGTTTDCAVIRGGHAVIAPEGVRVGDRILSIDAVDVTTVGLGGDSRLDFTTERRIRVGPVRNIPLCCLAAAHPAVMDFLTGFDERYHANSLNASTLDVLTLGGRAGLDLTAREAQLMELLQHGPLPALQATARMGLAASVFLPLERLEACGMVKRAALTPTDLLHADGRFVRWSRPAAERALTIFAALLGRPPAEVLALALEAVTRRLFEEILRREISDTHPTFHRLPAEWDYLLDLAFQSGKDPAPAGSDPKRSSAGTGSRRQAEGDLTLRMGLTKPVVAIGAPAGLLVPPVARHLDVEIIVPEHADVANALGAIGSEIVVREELLIRPGETAGYMLHGSDECMEFISLERATEKAVERARERVRRRAIEAGARAPEITISRRDRLGAIADGSSLLIERRVTAVASGGLFGAVAG